MIQPERLAVTIRERLLPLRRRTMLAVLASSLMLTDKDAASGKKRRRRKRNRNKKKKNTLGGGAPLRCGAGTAQCGNECLCACPEGKVIDQVDCGCCVQNEEFCNSQVDLCCSRRCEDNTCVGRDGGEDCQFGAQCNSNVCSEGFCTNL